MRVEDAMAHAASTDIAVEGLAAVAPRHALAHQPPLSPRRSPLSAFELVTSDLPAGDQFAAWRDSFAPMVNFDEPEDLAVGFEGKQIVWDLGKLAFARIQTDALSFTSLPAHIRRDPLDHWTLTLLLHGSMFTRTPLKAFAGEAGRIQIHSLGRSFSGHVSDSEMLMLFVPRDLYRDMVGVLDAAEFSTLDAGMGRLFADYMISLAKRLSTLDEADLPGLVEATRAMILACVAPCSDHVEAAREPLTTMLLERARRCVQSKLYDPAFDAETLRRELGISRTRLYRLFEPSGGVKRYIQHRRLLDAHSALADPNDHRRIFEIADERGFADGAEFSRAFKREFGYSPSDVRMGAHEIRVTRCTGAECLPSQRLGQVLRRLQV